VNVLWDYFWPIFAAGLVIGVATGLFSSRQLRIGSRNKLVGESRLISEWRRKRGIIYGGGVAAALVAAMLWHGPLGAGDRVAGNIERTARMTLEHYEMPLVTAKLERSPLRRRLLLSGPSDDFQQKELVRMMDEIPGVSSVRWTNPPGAPVEMAE
jgi:hypothetical protein